MGFLDFLQANPLKKLESEAESNPSPETVAALAQKHIELDQLDQALVVAERGLQTFRTAAKLRDIVLFVKKKRSAESIKRLRDEIRVKPSPSAYTQLGDIYRDLGEVDQALDLLTECTERFTEETVAYRLIGQIRLENFLQEVIAYDGFHAWNALRRVKELSPDDSQARVLLGQLYYAVGANAMAVQELREELAANPTALDIKSFLEDLGEPRPLEKDVTLDSLIERAEESGSLTNSLQGFPRVKPGLAQRTGLAPKINAVAAMAKVSALQETPGLLNLAILSREGTVIASVGNEGGMAPEEFRTLTAEVSRVSGEACRRMDIGSFVRGAVRFPHAGAAIVRRRGTTFALFYADPMKHDRAIPFLEDLVLKIVGGGGGA
ncbi:MAG: hypothetical protein HUU06_09905 [Planctomycetaceae bacterium]|nr:hypothetical protein [Planctomycetota bacterium]NUN53082.1 hypothetical protein [Planctomycetaceae bacterium]